MLFDAIQLQTRAYGVHTRSAVAKCNAHGRPSPAIFRPLQVVDIYAVPGRADNPLIDADIGRHLGDEADGAAQVLRLQHAGAILQARRDRSPVHGRRGHFGRADRAGRECRSHTLPY